MNNVDQLVEENIGLARDFANKQSDLGADHDSVFSDALLVLLKCAEKWNPEKAEFSTYYCTAVRNFKNNTRMRDTRMKRGGDGKGDMVYTKTSVYASDGEFLDIEDYRGQTRLQETEDLVTELLENLPEREREIMMLWYGIDRQETTLKQIGKMYNISKQRVGQIIERALEKMKPKVIESEYFC